MTRDAIVDHLCRFEPPALDIAATVQALEHAVVIGAQPAYDLLAAHVDRHDWRARHVSAPLPRWPLLWIEWGARTNEGAVPMGLLCSTWRTKRGYETEAVVFVDGGPFLRYSLMFDSDGDLAAPPSAPLFASMGGGLLMAHEWERQTSQAWTNLELLSALEWSSLATPLLALSLSNLSAAAPGRTQLPDALMARLTAGEPLFRAVGDLYHAEPIQAPLLAAGPSIPLWRAPEPELQEWPTQPTCLLSAAALPAASDPLLDYVVR